MTTPRQLRANRSNCLRSTGPKTGAGRAKSAQNARRHGLRVPLVYDPALAKEAEQLAQRIAAGFGPEFMELARRIAEAEVDVLRVGRSPGINGCGGGASKTLSTTPAPSANWLCSIVMNAGRYRGASLPFAPSLRLAPQSERQSAIEAGNDRKILEHPIQGGQTAEAKRPPQSARARTHAHCPFRRTKPI
jgi:hypothetical protein